MGKSKLVAALLVALAMMAVSASAAQAINWTAASYPAQIQAEQSSPTSTSFGFENSTTAKCDEVLLVGELTSASSSLTLAPLYKACTAFGFSEAIIEPNECDFVLKPTSGSSDTFSGTVDIKCPEGKMIVVVGGNCEVKIGAQSALGTVSYKTDTAATPDIIEATFSISTLDYDKTKDGPACPLTGTGSKTNGSVGGTLEIAAGKDGTLEPINIGMM